MSSYGYSLNIPIYINVEWNIIAKIIISFKTSI